VQRRGAGRFDAVDQVDQVLLVLRQGSGGERLDGVVEDGEADPILGQQLLDRVDRRLAGVVHLVAARHRAGMIEHQTKVQRRPSWRAHQRRRDNSQQQIERDRGVGTDSRAERNEFENGGRHERPLLVASERMTG